MLSLHILRHANTLSSSVTGKDFDRELSPKGLKQSEVLATFLKMNNLQPEVIFCSSAKRTRQTIKEVQDKFKFDNKVKFKDELYLASMGEMFDFVSNLSSENDAFIIGHNNGISDLITYLTDDFIDIPTCTFVTLSFDVDNWCEISKGLAKMDVYFSPKEG
jgi:phosphohistidine phosphatase